MQGANRQISERRPQSRGNSACIGKTKTPLQSTPVTSQEAVDYPGQICIIHRILHTTSHMFHGVFSFSSCTCKMVWVQGEQLLRIDCAAARLTRRLVVASPYRQFSSDDRTKLDETADAGARFAAA